MTDEDIYKDGQFHASEKVYTCINVYIYMHLHAYALCMNFQISGQPVNQLDVQLH